VRVGDVVGNRFAIEELASSGGMGHVYRARDTATGRIVAVKSLQAHGSQDTERFEREARLLSTIDHPAVVNYVGHGRTERGELFLAMEWLEGEDLSERLARGPLGVAESIALTARLADALGWLHARGVAHRDVKPANIFVPRSGLANAKLLDFGIARPKSFTRALTQTGQGLGTPGYMAPEQVRGDRVPDDEWAGADVFALGCVLFECLSGTPAFVGANVMAVLAKVLFEDVPRVGDHVSSVPRAVDALVMQMMSKDRLARPRDGAAVVRALVGIDLAAPHSSNGPASSSLTGGEQRLVCAIVASERVLDTDGETLAADVAATSMALAKDNVERFGGRLERLADGTLVAILASEGAATDRAVQGARCAIALLRGLPTARVAMAMGFAEMDVARPVGAVIDRAARMLSRTDATKHGVAVDELTSGLLDARFEVARDGSQLVLAAERGGASRRMLLGKPTPFVGRERELASIEAIARECVSDSVARAVIVTAAPGVGKSRLRAELESRFRDADERVWSAACEPSTAGSAFALLATLLRGTLGARVDESTDTLQRLVRERVARRVAESARARVSVFLGEPIGAQFDATNDEPLRAARADPMVMSDSVRAAFEDFVAAECADQSLTIIVEDLHWGDLPSVRLLDAALRSSRDSPLLVIAFARPEVLDTFPGLWSARGAIAMPLGDLSKKVSARLVRAVLGDRIDDDALTHIVDRAGGNALFLEELIRAAAEGRHNEVPATVFAMLGARLERLPADARRVMRAASIFGQSFWMSAVGALTDGADTSSIVRGLLDGEWLESRDTARFAGEHEIAFRHALVRDAAYATLTDVDRALGHRLAGHWLESKGEPDPTVLAEHFARGGESARAIDRLRDAAAQALDGNDFAAVIRHCERAESLGAAGPRLGELRGIEAEALFWLEDFAGSMRRALDAVELSPPLSPSFCRAIGECSMAAGRTGARDVLERLDRTLLDAIRAHDGPLEAHVVIAAARLSAELFVVGEVEQGEALLSVLNRCADPNDAAVVAWINRARGHRGLACGIPSDELTYLGLSADQFERIGDTRNAAIRHVVSGCVALDLGAYAVARDRLQRGLVAAHKLPLAILVRFARNCLRLALVRLGDHAGARALPQDVLIPPVSLGDRLNLFAIRAQIACIAALDEEPLAALLSLAEAMSSYPLARAAALARAARLLTARGEDGSDCAREALALLEGGATLPAFDIAIRLAWVESEIVRGRSEASERMLARMRDELLESARRIDDDALRASYLRAVPENARVLELAG